MCQDEGTFWQFWWFLCGPESPFFVEQDSSAISEEELRFHWHYTAHVCWNKANTVAGARTDAGMFVGKGQRTICNCTWGHFHTCSLLAGQWLATQLHKNLCKNWANIVLHFWYLGVYRMQHCCQQHLLRLTHTTFHSYLPKRHECRT